MRDGARGTERRRGTYGPAVPLPLLRPGLTLPSLEGTILTMELAGGTTEELGFFGPLFGVTHLPSGRREVVS